MEFARTRYIALVVGTGALRNALGEFTQDAAAYVAMTPGCTDTFGIRETMTD